VNVQRRAKECGPAIQAGIASPHENFVAMIDVCYNKICCRNATESHPMSDRALLVCPFCGKELHFFESFPGQSGLPEVDVFTCDACEKMILQDRTPSAPAPVPDRRRAVAAAGDSKPGGKGGRAA